MKRIMMAAAGAALMAGCSGGGDADADSNGETTASEVAAKVEAEGVKPEPGLYRATITMTGIDIPGMPAEMAGHGSGMVTTTENCLTQEDVDKGFEEMLKQGQQGECSYERFDIDNGKVDAVMMRIVDTLYALPFTIFVILLMVAFGRSLWLIFVAIGAVEWLSMARIVRAGVIGLKKQEFVEAAVSLGYSHTRIILRHLIPNVLGPVIVIATLTVPAVMLLEAFLSFLGLGVQPPDASWGVLINEGQQNMEIFLWLLLFPAFFFALTLFTLNFLGDGLRDALDPKSAKD